LITCHFGTPAMRRSCDAAAATRLAAFSKNAVTRWKPESALFI
jgi:hypothetical protein